MVYSYVILPLTPNDITSKYQIICREQGNDFWYVYGILELPIASDEVVAQVVDYLNSKET